MIIDRDELFEDFYSSEPVGTYGLPFLDDELVSINKGELVLIGADSGVGKSTLANLIATHNLKNGRKVALFSIENSQGDYKRKEIWKKYKKKTRNFDLTFRNFNACINFGQADKGIYKECKEEVEKEMEGLVLIEHTRDDFSLTTLEAGIQEAVKQKGCEMIVFDHIDYLDEEEIESLEKEYKKKQQNFLKVTMKAIRSLGQIHKVPIVVFSQLRKSNDSKMLVPSIDEFYGSSDKVKIATTVITLAPNYEGTKNDSVKSNCHTFVCIRKDRFDGRGVADCVFNLKTQSYNNGYMRGTVDKYGYKITLEETKKGE